MKTLYIYPTSRAIRRERERAISSNQLLPTLMRIDEFEREVILLPELNLVDTLKRVIILRRASNFESFKNLKINRELIKFFTKSDSILKFFEELSFEMVEFSDLIGADAFAEFEEHIQILEELFLNYRKILNREGLTDRAFIPKEYSLNRGFIASYERYELFLEGYMSRFELKLIQEVAREKPFIIHFQTSKFNQKVQTRFRELGIEDFPKNSFISFDLYSKRILSVKRNELSINAKVLSVEERLSQIPILLESVQNMVNRGIPPKEIAVILPDEKFKDIVKTYDTLNNFNFAMGFDYNKTQNYRELEAIYNFWHNFGDEQIELLIKYGIDLKRLKELKATKVVKVHHFFQELSKVVDLNLKELQESYNRFKILFKNEEMPLKTFLFLWLKLLNRLSIDDIRGGKVTVIGALETRGVKFKGVVILDFNDGIVPAIPTKDNFLNSSVRKFANLPTKGDREALQKQLYKRFLEEADEAVILYSQSNNRTPTSYLYELGLWFGKESEPNLKLLYNQPSQILPLDDPIITNFNAQNIVWSATRLKTFLSCRRKYYYLYEKGLRPQESDEINEGAFLHKIMDKLFKYRDSFENFETMQIAISKLLDSLLDDSTVKIKYTKLLWKKRLSRFINSQIYHFKSGYRVIEREKHIKGEIGGVNFKGVVDRVDRKGEYHLVVDYKTGSIIEANRTKNLEKLTDFQMSIYYELLNGEYKNIDLVFMELFNGKITPITELKKKNSLLHIQIEKLKELQEFKASRCDEVNRCQYCDYKLLCERGEYQ